MKRGQTHLFLRQTDSRPDCLSMARRSRVVIAGAPHHVTQRGNNRQAVFLSPDDQQHYLELLGWHAERCGLRILAYCRMTNHVHLIAVPERAEERALQGQLFVLALG